MAETPFSPDSTPGETAAVEATDSEAHGLNDNGTASGSGRAGDGEVEQSGAALTGEPASDTEPGLATSAPGEATPPAPCATDSGHGSTEAPAGTTTAAASTWSAPETSGPEAASPIAADFTASASFATALGGPEVMVASMDSEAPPEAAAAAEAPPDAPAETVPAGIAATIAVPPLERAAGEGGEWELLVGKLNAWFSSGELNRQWQKIRGPLKGAAILFGVILTLRLYASVIATIDRIPVVSGLLELIGLIGLTHFGLTKMIRTSEREQVLANWKQRWQAFSGQD